MLHGLQICRVVELAVLKTASLRPSDAILPSAFGVGTSNLENRFRIPFASTRGAESPRQNFFRDILDVGVSSPHTPPFLRKGRGRKRGTKGQKAKERREEKKVFGLAETRPLLGLTCVSIFASSPAREVEESGEKESFTHQRPHHLSCPQVSPPFLPLPVRVAPEGKEIT